MPTRPIACRRSTVIETGSAGNQMHPGAEVKLRGVVVQEPGQQALALCRRHGSIEQQVAQCRGLHQDRGDVGVPADFLQQSLQLAVAVLAACVGYGSVSSLAKRSSASRIACARS